MDRPSQALLDVLADPEMRESVAEILWPSIVDKSRGRVLPETKDYGKIRWLTNGSDIVNNLAGSPVAMPGESYSDRINVIGGALYWSNKPGQRQLNIAVGQHAPCYDYVVSSDGTGTNLTLDGSSGAWAAAVTASAGNVPKTIWMCNSETLTAALPVNGMNNSAISIHGPGLHDPNPGTNVPNHARITITAAANLPIFRESAQSTGSNSIACYGIALSVGGGQAIVQYDTFTGTNSNLFNLDLDECGINATGANAGIVKAVTAVNSQLSIRMRKCYGQATYVSVNTAGSGSAPDRLDMIDTAGMTFAGGLWSNYNPENGIIEGGWFTVSASTDVTSMQKFVVRDVVIVTSVVIFTSTGATTTGSLNFANIRVQSTGGGGAFCNLASPSGGSAFSNLYIHGVHGIATGGLPSAMTFVVVDTDWLRVFVADIWAPDWGTLYNGPAAGYRDVRSVVADVDGTLTTQKTVIGPMPQAGQITDVTCKTNDGVTIGAVAWVGTIYKVLAANRNTDGGTTEIFTTRPTITNGNMAQVYGPPDLTPLFAAGDFLVFSTTQNGTNATLITMTATVIYT